MKTKFISQVGLEPTINTDPKSAASSNSAIEITQF